MQPNAFYGISEPRSEPAIYNGLHSPACFQFLSSRHDRAYHTGLTYFLCQLFAQVYPSTFHVNATASFTEMVGYQLWMQEHITVYLYDIVSRTTGYTLVAHHSQSETPQGGRLQSGRLRHTRPSSGFGPPSREGKVLRMIKGGHPIEYRKVISRDNDYILHTYGRSQVVLAEGEGMTARDADGKSYLDFTSGIGVNSLGYCTPRGSGLWPTRPQRCSTRRTCITPPPTASWRKSSAAAPGRTPCSSATRAPRPTRARSSAPANTA